MSHKLLLLGVILMAGLGCGMIDRAQKAVTESQTNTSANVNANRSLTDRAVDTAVGDQKVGIPECDEAIELLAAQADNPDDNFVVKAGKRTALNMFREQVKKSLEQNQTNQKEVVEFCKEARDNLRDSVTEANSNTSK